MKNLLIIGKGDTNYSDRNPRRLYRQAKKKGFEVHRLEYGDAPPKLDDGIINVFLFFPYQFWNEICEVPQDTELYGTSGKVCDLLDDFFLKTDDILRRYYESGRHEINYVIDPRTAASDRDKIGIIKKLRSQGVPTSETIDSTNLQEILGEITPQKGVFIKCRYGAEGKGVTYLSFNRWSTNYRIDGDRLTNYGTNDDWLFTDITGREELLEELLQHEVVIEREIVSPRFFESKKFDLRAYVVEEEVVYFFARLNESGRIITNYSQGGKVKHNPEKIMPAKSSRIVKETAQQAAVTLRSRFIGVDMMFDGSFSSPKVVEVQTFTDFPDIRYFNLAEYLVDHSEGLIL